jgi:transposase-like protein
VGKFGLDEVFVSTGGGHMYLWRAVDDEGEVLDILVQRRRDRRAAFRQMRKLLKKQGFAPQSWTTDKLPSYGAALQELGAGGRHRTRGFKSSTSAQKFLAIHAAVYNTFNHQHHLISRSTLRQFRTAAVFA